MDTKEEFSNFNIMVAFGLPISADKQGSTCEENEQGVSPEPRNNKRRLTEMETQELDEIVTNSEAYVNI